MLEARLNESRRLAAKYEEMYKRTGNAEYKRLRDHYRMDVDRLWQRLLNN